jgi:hypothetical protein
MGRLEDAKEAVKSVLDIAPRYRIASSQRMFPYPEARDRERLVDSLRAAGLPE